MAGDQPVSPVNRELTTSIVAVYVRRHQIGADQIDTLISTVHQALAAITSRA
jgi:predicted transcriptional regulator